MKDFKHILFLTIKSCILFVLPIAAQEIQFSQYYNLIQYQNPAFVGSSYAWRGILHNRIQWPGIDSRYISTVLSVDYNFSKYNSGLGAMIIHDDQGASAVKSIKTNLQYAYLLHLTKNVFLRSGMNVGFTRRTLNNAALYYPDQFTGSGFSNTDNVPKLNKSYVDLTAGLLLFTDRAWFGISAAHLNQPNSSFIGSIERIPIKYDFLAGYKITLKSLATMRYLEKEDDDLWTLYPTVLYKWQGKSDQLDVGLYSIYKVLKLGVWYRGIPIKNYNKELANNESIIALAGFKIENFSMTYSYDFVISKLGPYARGGHEINVTILYPKRKNFKQKFKYRRLPCPDFYH